MQCAQGKKASRVLCYLCGAIVLPPNSKLMIVLQNAVELSNGKPNKKPEHETVVN